MRKGQWTVLAPVTERGEVLGLLEMSLPGEPHLDTLSEIARTAHLLGFVVIANRRHTDLFEWGQRSTSFTLPAEINVGCCRGPHLRGRRVHFVGVVGAAAATSGGDTFDYSLGRDVLHLSNHGCDGSRRG